MEEVIRKLSLPLLSLRTVDTVTKFRRPLTLSPNITHEKTSRA